MIVMIILLALVTLALAAVLVRMIARMVRERVRPSCWLILVAGVVGAGLLGYCLNSIPVRVGPETKIYGIPAPFVFVIKEGDQWTDFVFPIPVTLAIVIMNVAVFALGGALALWWSVGKKLKSQNQASEVTARKLAEPQG